MGLIPEDLKRQVIERNDIVEIIGDYTALKKAGRNFKALCPFHNEKTPSFIVNPDRQVYHCFGCHVGGDVISFIQRQERMDFPEAVRFLAAKAGVVIPEDQGADQSPSRQLREEILKINAWAAEFYHEILLTSREASAKGARDYLKGRGIGLEAVKKFQLGFAPDEWDVLLKYFRSKGIGEELVFKAGLIIAREGKSGYYDRFRSRIVFPIADVQGRSVAFGARAMKESDGAKYINSPETPVYTKGRHMFGLQLTKTAAAKAEKIIVVEGYMDMIMPYIHGVDNIAACLGTALTSDQVSLIGRYAQNVVMLFDTDAAGQSAIVRSLDLLLEAELNVRVATLEQGEDPDSFIRKRGLEAFNARLENAQPFLDFKFNWLSAQYDPRTVEGKDKISQELLSTIDRCKSEVVKYELTKQLAQKLDIPEGVLLKQSGRTAESTPSEAPEVSSIAPVLASSGQELLLALFLKDAAWARAALEKIGPEDFTQGPLRHTAEAVLKLAREKGEWSATDLLARLDDMEAQSAVARLMHIEARRLGDEARVFEDCISKIHREKQKQARGRLMEAIRRAEASHDTEKLDQLREQFNQLLRT